MADKITAEEVMEALMQYHKTVTDNAQKWLQVVNDSSLSEEEKRVIADKGLEENAEARIKFETVEKIYKNLQ